ncbi:metal-dependent hydrolase [Erythrobacter aureus]|uniref:Metal-dependent hydrolase n=1 Tax=Erythrobacter aureus TaxID=2182384 RepID=A0A345YCB2_9SPHN|nr:metal-dependent hydrolase [Erythrobacter aureus]AXK41564.1 metal-dependent hydrolase [Erythrobacter aureus]
MSSYSKSPDNLVIPVRNLKFRLEPGPSDAERWWHGGDPVPTAFFNALSSTFPDGERFFMDSVRRFQGLASEPLRSQIKSFIGQEAVHSREHLEFNAFAAKAGYNIAALERRAKRALASHEKRSDVRKLAATCALEHFTAILAHALLSADSADLAGAPEEARRLWSWHAVEELEHKAVAYDTFLLATKGWSRPRRYLVRVAAMMISTWVVMRVIGANMASLYRQDGINTPKTWWRTLKYLLVAPGALRRIMVPYARYYRPGFHPWDHDDRDLLAKTHARYDLSTG